MGESSQELNADVLKIRSKLKVQICFFFALNQYLCSNYHEFVMLETQILINDFPFLDARLCCYS